MNEYEDLFSDLSYEKGIGMNLSKSDKILIYVESEFVDGGITTEEEKSRLSEEESIRNKKKLLQDKLFKYRNVKNPKLQHVNKQRAEKRKEIKREIVVCDLRLQEIDAERQGPK